MASHAIVRRPWVVEAAKAINKKMGVILSDVMQNGLEEAVFEPLGMEQIKRGASSGSGAALDVYQSIIEIVTSGVRSQIAHQLQQMPPGPEYDPHADKLYTEVLVRVVAANVVYRQSLLQIENNKARPQPNDGEADDAACEEEDTKATAHAKLMKGLLYAFEPFQEAHMMDRSHYRTAKLTRAQWQSSAETPGWDTVPLMTMVHLVQRAAQQGGSAVTSDALTQIVRSWRKLMVYLQSADPDVAPEFSRRRGALAVVNGLLGMLFQHNNTHQCRALLQSIEQNEKLADSNPANITKSVLRPASHMIAEIIKFRYFQGRMKLYEKKLAEATSSFMIAYRLTPALSQCSQPQRDNKLRIHFYWITAAILAGQQPPTQMLQLDPLCRQVFSPIIQAISEGNPVAFCRALDRHASILRRRGVYMLLHQARILCYLYLVQRVHSIVGDVPGTDNSKLSVNLVLEAAKHVMQGKRISDDALVNVDDDAAAAREVEDEETHGDNADTSERKRRPRMARLVAESLDIDALCMWIARLITRGFIRGYLSYEHKTLVLSKASPFPTIAIIQ